MELQTNFGLHSHQAIFLGYPDGTKGHRVHDVETNSFFVARDVIFGEKLPMLIDAKDDDNDELDNAPPDPNPGPDPTVSGPPDKVPPVEAPPQPNAAIAPRRSSRQRVLTQVGKAYAKDRAAAHTLLEALQEQQATRTSSEGVDSSSEGVSGSLSEGVIAEENTNSLKAIEPDAVLPNATTGAVIEEHSHVVEEQAHITIRSDKRRDPSQPDYNMAIPLATYKEAVQWLDKQEWLNTMETKLKTMKDMCVYELTSLPMNRKAIGCRWVLEFKEDNKGGLIYKARLVAQVFSQVPGVDYGATFTPVIKPASVRLLTALACQKDWEIDMFDAKHAFLWGLLKEEIYMHQPKGFEEGDWRESVWLMLRSIYGLKQSTLEWYKQVCMVMAELGFTRTESNHTLFHFEGTAELAIEAMRIRCFIGWHVDDGMGVSNSRPFLEKVESKIAERFRIKNLGPVTKYLGI